MNRLTKALALALLTLAAGALGAACSNDGARVGEACTTPGSETECEDDAVCDAVDATVVCLAVCEDDDDCAANEQCNGVSSSSIKACHVKK